jgi:transcription initiation factor TFIID subunit 6
MMQAATQATLSNLVEQHLTSLIREAATVNRHSKRGDIITAAADDKAHDRQRKRRRIIHHDDVNMALQWRGSEKLYVSGVVTPPKDDISAKTANKQTKTDIPTLVDSTTVPRIDLNTYLSSKNTLRPPSELGMTLHWLAVDGVSPLIPMNSVYNQYRRDVTGEDLTSGQDITDVVHIDNAEDPDSSIRIRELQHRLLSEELQLYYSRVITAISSADSSSQIISTALHGIRYDKGIQELVPFLCRFIAAGLMDKKNLRNTEYARRLVRVFDALLENRSLHLDLHVSESFSVDGSVVCIVLSHKYFTMNQSFTKSSSQ